jgi:predicted metal-binding protein
MISALREMRKPTEDSHLDSLKPSIEEKTVEDGLEYLLKRALQLGAERAKVIYTDTIVVEEWVRWKCQYGCVLYEKDAFHPPYAPDAESTKKMIKEYSKAILMNGPKGKPLTEAAVRLEGEAYKMGYYKAFALTALSSGPAGAA